MLTLPRLGNRISRMQEQEATLLKDLLTQTNVLSLGILVDGAPYVGLLPFVLAADYHSLIIHASGLAIHSRGLQPAAPFSALIHAAERPGSDPLQLPRVTFQGTVVLFEKETDAYRDASELYISRFPQSRQTFLLDDFNLYGLQIRSGRLVAGFARTVNLGVHHLEKLKES